jgi:cation transport regulator ChaC
VSETLWYFAYGSNMCRAIFVERRTIQPSTSTWGWLAGWRLCFDLPVGPGERGVANLVPDAAASTCGVLHRISIEEAALLDRTEGVHGGLYQRVAVAVAAAHGETITAFTYQSTLTPSPRKPSPRYMGLLLDGAREHGLPPEYVAYLQSFALAHDERS